MEKKVSLNGGIAYRDGAALHDNPFDQATQANSWDYWRTQFKREQDRRVGPSAYDDKI